ncbi:MAG: FtsQ-type POTRA domain-containing protein [Clostridia bacterium]|nr:FtsQ-type POTRA domain-containing protein [Clostridia bacterium]
MAQKKKTIKLKRRQKKQITALTLVIIVAALIVIMLLTPGFDIKEINVYGTSVIDENDIIKSSGIVKGVNIFSVSLKNAKDNIEEMGYVESVKVKRNLPSSIDIEVVEAAGVAYIVTKNGHVMITADGRCIDLVNLTEGKKDEQKQLPVIRGIKSIKYKIGDKIKSEETDKINVLFECLKEFSKYGYVFEMEYIDVSDMEDIRFSYNQGKLKVSMGSREKIPYKVECFGPILEAIGENPEGFIDLERLTYRKREKEIQE